MERHVFYLTTAMRGPEENALGLALFVLEKAMVVLRAANVSIPSKSAPLTS